MLLFSVGFNLSLYRLEPTAKIDPNDNPFQYALVDRTNQIWDYANRTCPRNMTFILCHVSYLVDHWVPNWAEGYNLPFYYSHIPQIAIVGSWKLITSLGISISLFSYYHLVIYWLLCLMPIPFYLGFRVIGFSPLIAGFGTLISSHLSTDGLYGIDPVSFLWRGFGLSSQLFGVFWMPLAVAYSYRVLNASLPVDRSIIPRLRAIISSYIPFIIAPKENYKKSSHDMRNFWLAVLFLVCTTAGHLGLGIMAMMSLGFLTLGYPLLLFLLKINVWEVLDTLLTQLIRMTLLAGTSIFFLSYWIIPTLLLDTYHNFSLWDPVWKFNSYGWIETLIMFFTGDLFDFHRFPTLTLLVIVGIFVSFLTIKTKDETPSRQSKHIFDEVISRYPFVPLGFHFIFWMIFFFGRTTWGPLIDLIPGMKEVHLSRFIVGVHLSGLFLIVLGFSYITDMLGFILIKPAVRLIKPKTDRFYQFLYVVILSISGAILCAVIIPRVYEQTISYSLHNDTLIRQANAKYDTREHDVLSLFQTIAQYRYSGRFFAGRGGSWGKQFEVAETPVFMHLSTYGYPTVLWLPETWSMNSDMEQYISEDKKEDYNLYNIRFVVAPPSQPMQPFWKLLKTTGFWNLYEVETDGYITTGIRAARIFSNKYNFINIAHQWIQSDYPSQQIYPEINLMAPYWQQGLAAFSMIDEITYKTFDGSTHSLFEEPPTYAIEPNYAKVDPISQTNDSDMTFSATVTVDENCMNCVAILKQTDHPNWRVSVDGKSVDHVTVFPFFIAVPLRAAGVYKIVFSYEPSTLKVFLLIVQCFGAFALTILFIRSKLISRRKNNK